MKWTGRLALIALSLCAVIATWLVLFDGQLAPSDDVRHPRKGAAILGGYSTWSFASAVLITDIVACGIILSLVRARRKCAQRLLGAHAAAAFLLATLELTAVLGVDYLGLIAPVPDYSQDDRLRWSGKPHAIYRGRNVPDLVYRLKLEPVYHPVHVQRDRFGLRNPRDKVDAQVFCLGDSFLEASLIPIEETVTERLERALNIPVMNVAESGYCLQEELVRLETLDLDLEGRTVVQFLFEGNDVAESFVYRRWLATPGRRSWPPNTKQPWPGRGFLNLIVQMLKRPLQRDTERRAGTYSVPGQEPQKVWFFYDGLDLSRHRAEVLPLLQVLTRAHADMTARKTHYGVVFLPCKATVLGPYCTFAPISELRDPKRLESPLRPIVTQHCQREGIPFFDVTDALREGASSRLPYIEKDSHLNAYGHSILARVLEPWVRSLRTP